MDKSRKYYYRLSYNKVQNANQLKDIIDVYVVNKAYSQKKGIQKASTLGVNTDIKKIKLKGNERAKVITKLLKNGSINVDSLDGSRKKALINTFEASIASKKIPSKTKESFAKVVLPLVSDKERNKIATIINKSMDIVASGMITKIPKKLKKQPIDAPRKNQMSQNSLQAAMYELFRNTVQEENISHEKERKSSEYETALTQDDLSNVVFQDEKSDFQGKKSTSDGHLPEGVKDLDADGDVDVKDYEIKVDRDLTEISAKANVVYNSDKNFAINQVSDEKSFQQGTSFRDRLIAQRAKEKENISYGI